LLWSATDDAPHGYDKTGDPKYDDNGEGYHRKHRQSVVQEVAADTEQPIDEHKHDDRGQDKERWVEGVRRPSGHQLSALTPCADNNSIFRCTEIREQADITHNVLGPEAKLPFQFETMKSSCVGRLGITVATDPV